MVSRLVDPHPRSRGERTLPAIPRNARHVAAEDHLGLLVIKGPFAPEFPGNALNAIPMTDKFPHAPLHEGEGVRLGNSERGESRQIRLASRQILAEHLPSVDTGISLFTGENLSGHPRYEDLGAGHRRQVWPQTAHLARSSTVRNRHEPDLRPVRGDAEEHPEVARFMDRTFFEVGEKKLGWRHGVPDPSTPIRIVKCCESAYLGPFRAWSRPHLGHARPAQHQQGPRRPRRHTCRDVAKWTALAMELTLVHRGELLAKVNGCAGSCYTPETEVVRMIEDSNKLSEQDWKTLETLVARLPAELEHLAPQLGDVQEFRNAVDQFTVLILEIALPAALGASPADTAALSTARQALCGVGRESIVGESTATPGELESVP